MRKSSLKLLVDETICDGHGICAELVPEWIYLDPFGFPILREGELPFSLKEHALRAVYECPKLAIALIESPG
ncbi:MAG: ferredoxin [Acidimicrobiales bacterium]|nr:ferredoxin [Acidimicrobiales bacterium]